MVLTFICRLGELILPTNIVTFCDMPKKKAKKYHKTMNFPQTFIKMGNREEVKAVNIFFLIQRILCFRVHG